MLPMPHTSIRLVELHQRHLRAEVERLRQGHKSPTRMTHRLAAAWDHCSHWVTHWWPDVRLPRLWRWSST